MKAKDKIQLAKQLLPNMTEFTVKGSMMFMRPIGHILRAVHFESSASDAKSLYVSVFLLPLFVPMKYIHFTFGYRIRGHKNIERWQTDSVGFLDNLKESLSKNSPFLYDIKSLDDFIKTIRLRNNPQNLYVEEAIAYTLALNGDTAESISALSNLIPLFDVESPWQLEMQERARTLKTSLEEDPSVAIKLLEGWESETIKNLGLEKFASA